MSIVYLTPNDFHVTTNNEFANKFPKFSLVFFSSINCMYCKDVLPAFVHVSTTIKGCTYAIMDVDQQGMRVVKMASTTKLPIKYVPFIVMYVNGIPISVFDPDEDNVDNNYTLLKQFIVNNANAVRSGKPNGVTGTRPPSEYKVCDTSIGMAICGKKKICYLKDCEAYPPLRR